MNKNSGPVLILVFIVVLVGAVFYLRARNPEAFARLGTDFSALVGSSAAKPSPAEGGNVAANHPPTSKHDTHEAAPPSVTANPAKALPTKLALPALKAANAAAKTASALANNEITPPPRPAALSTPHAPSAPTAAPTPVPAAVTPGIISPASTQVGDVATQAKSDTVNATENPSTPGTFSSPSPAGEAAPAAAAAWTPPAKLPAKPNWTWTTTDGHTYKNVKVVKVEPDNVTILYEEGGAHIPLSTLSPDFQKMFNYNPDAAAQWAVRKLLAGNLVSLKGAALQPVNDSAVSPIKYFAIYYSADWCPPCHAFTPRLVRFYNDFKPTHPDFELIFVSEDHNPVSMLAYMKDMSMPWPAFRFDQLIHPSGTFKAPGIEEYANAGIPDLVLVDSTGKVLSDSYNAGHYVGPDAVVDDIKTMVQ